MSIFRQGQSTAMISLDISKAYDMCKNNILKKLKIWKIDGKMLHFISDLMRERTHRVAVASTLLDERRIENGEVRGAVLSVTLFLVEMAGVTGGKEEPIKIIGYADDWMVHITHQRVATI
jgi:hypothetical protein